MTNKLEILDTNVIEKIAKFAFEKKKKIKYNTAYKIIKFIDIIDFDKENLEEMSSDESSYSSRDDLIKVSLESLLDNPLEKSSDDSIERSNENPYNESDIKHPSSVIQIFFENNDYIRISVQNNIVCDSSSEIEEKYQEINSVCVYYETNISNREYKQITPQNYHETIMKKILFNNKMKASASNVKKLAQIILDYANEHEIILSNVFEEMVK